MPMKSKAQRRKFAQLLVDGKITPEAYERWNQETGRRELPERVRPKKTAKKTTRKTTARKTVRKSTARKTTRSTTARKGKSRR